MNVLDACAIRFGAPPSLKTPCVPGVVGVDVSPEHTTEDGVKAALDRLERFGLDRFGASLAGKAWRMNQTPDGWWRISAKLGA